MGFKLAGPTKFFGKGTDSVFGQVGREVSNNFAEFKEVIGGALKSPTTRATLIDDKLNITKVGGVELDQRNVDPYAGKDPAITRGMSAADVKIRSADVLQDFKLDLAEQVGPEGAANFEKVLQGADFKDLDDFGKLKSIQANPNYFTKVVYAPENSMKKWTTYNSAIGTEEQLKNPFGKIFDIDSSTQTMGQKMREGLSLEMPKPGQMLSQVGTGTATSLLTNKIMGGGQQVGDVGPQFSLGQFYQPNLGRYDSQLQESQYAYGGLDPSLVTSAMSGAQDYNQLLSGLMGQDATQSQGMYKGTFQPLQTIGLPQYGTSPQF